MTGAPPSPRQPAGWITLLRAVQDGGRGASDAALTTLLHQLRPVLMRYNERRLHRLPDARDAASDVAQEVLLRVANGVRACDAATDAQFLSWVFTIARHVLVDAVRSPGRRLLARQPLAEYERAEHQHVFEMWMHGGNDHPAGAPRGLLRLVCDAYDELPDATAELLWMRLVESASWAEVAAAFHTSPAAAKRRYQRAQRRLLRRVLRRIASLPAAEQAALRRHRSGRALRRTPSPSTARPGRSDDLVLD